ncbi:MAG: protein of unknown function DUF3365 [Idiomarinaceae bacterium HL-53]|nr:MAG: protein of unknown function DUF3365 [Idiomarinaceae bacterium HL-53]CUS47729.1 Protein of unknown function (DUF3365) [Idiomarinaceae bacterium HL-53]
MKYLVKYLSILLFSTACVATEQDSATDLAMALQRDLGTKLMTAMMSEGPIAALHVCNVEAQEITEQHQNEVAIVTRISHRVRNPKNEIPSEYAAAYAELLDGFVTSNGQMKALDTTVVGDKRISLRAIPTAQHCLACHGGDIEADLKSEIQRLYPTDQAVDFALGEMRGAFLIEWQSQ